MKTDIELLEEQAELARARLKRRLDSFSNQYSLSAFKEASRQLGHKQEIRSVSSAIDSLSKNPASSALLALAAGQLLGAKKEPAQKADSPPSFQQDTSKPENLEPIDTEAGSSAMSWARQHPILSSATALAIGIGAGYLLLNGRSQKILKDERSDD